MRKSTLELLQDQKAVLEADPVALVKSGWLKIASKDGECVPLIPNSTQQRTLDIIQNRRKQGRPVFLLILKARQLGVSTLIQSIIYSFTSLRSYINSLVVADDVDGASYIFKMNELFYDKLSESHPHLVPPKKRSSEERLEFEGTYSKLMIDTAKNATAGRKFTLKCVHLSEAAFFPNFSGLMKGLIPAVSKTEDTIFIVETTAHGINEFSKFYWKMKAAYESNPDTTDWIVTFFSWKEHAEYSRPFSNPSLKDQFEKSLSDHERKIAKDHGLTLEQLHWRRQTIEDGFNGDEEKFQVEFPLTDKEAFVSTSKRVFPPRLVDPQVPHIMTPPLHRGELELVNRRAAFVEDPQGFLKIYQAPQVEERYVIGADSCEGALTHDEACAQVIKRSTWTQVAHLHGHMNPEDFAERLFSLGMFYNRALLAPEKNGPGLVTISRLTALHYPNLARHKKAVFSESGQWEETEEYGFDTNVKTKGLIIGLLQDDLRNLQIVLHDPLTIAQLETYVILNANAEGEIESKTKDGKIYIKYGAEQGHRDDCVMALAIGNHYCHQMPAQNAARYSDDNRLRSHSRTGY